MHRPGRIAIDGPAGSGKSTVGEQLARKLGYLYFDTGAMYRAVAWLALQEGVDIHDGTALGELARQADIVIDHPHIEDGRQYTVKVGEQDVTWAIRTSPSSSVSLPNCCTQFVISAGSASWKPGRPEATSHTLAFCFSSNVCGA